ANGRNRGLCRGGPWTGVDGAWAKRHTARRLIDRLARAGYRRRIVEAVIDTPVATHARRAESVLDLIGQTPLLRLGRFAPEGGELWAQLEFLHPGGSIQARAG